MAHRLPEESNVMPVSCEPLPPLRFVAYSIRVPSARSLIPKASEGMPVTRSAGGFSLARWSSITPEKPGMWWRVQLPQLTTFTEIQFDSTRAGESGGKGTPTPDGPGTAAFAAFVQVAVVGADLVVRLHRWVFHWVPRLRFRLTVRPGCRLRGQGRVRYDEHHGKTGQGEVCRDHADCDAPNAVAWNMEKFRLFGSPVVAVASAARPATQSAVKPAAPKTH